MRFVTTPTRTWLRDAIGRCRHDIAIASPYVTAALNDELKCLRPGVKRQLITRTELPIFASRASDLESLIEFAQEGGAVFSLPGLHAKVYLLDHALALVTSANATFSGLSRNWECGVIVDGTDEVAELERLLKTGFGSPLALQRWHCTELKSLRSSVEDLRAALPLVNDAKMFQDGEFPDLALMPGAWQDAFARLPGWTRLTLEAVVIVGEAEFGIEQIYATGLPMAQSRYPNNTAPKEKLRQQLQRLRDLGLVEFLGNGNYRLLVRRLKLDGQRESEK